MTSESLTIPERIIINYHKRKRYLRKIVVACCIGIAILSGLFTYHLTSSLSEQTVVEIILIQVLFAFLSLLATLAWSPRIMFVMSAFAGIAVGAWLRVMML